MDQERSAKRSTERGTIFNRFLYYKAVIESLLVTTVSSKNRLARVTDSSLYRGGISGRYIRGRLSRSLGRKSPCTEM